MEQAFPIRLEPASVPQVRIQFRNGYQKHECFITEQEEFE